MRVRTTAILTALTLTVSASPAFAAASPEWEYDGFIRDLRRQLAVEAPNLKGFPTLRLGEDQPHAFITVSLDEMLPGPQNASLSEVEVIIDPANLYLYGYRVDKTNELFYYKGLTAANKTRVLAFQGSGKPTELSFKVSYPSLTGFTISRANLEDAHKTLADTTTILKQKGDDSVRDAIDRFAVSIAEGVRFDLINDKIKTAMRNGGAYAITSQDETWLKKWSATSAYLLQEVGLPSAARKPFNFGGTMGEVSFDQVHKNVAVLKRQA